MRTFIPKCIIIILTNPGCFSYVAALELRIEKLQRRLAFAKSRIASVSHHESDLAPPPPRRTAKTHSP